MPSSILPTQLYLSVGCSLLGNMLPRITFCQTMELKADLRWLSTSLLLVCQINLSSLGLNITLPNFVQRASGCGSFSQGIGAAEKNR